MPDSIETQIQVQSTIMALESQIRQVQSTIVALETQRPILGDAVVDTALAPLREKLVALQAQQSRQTPMEERRLVTILFADVAGSTSLAEKMDPEEWHSIISQLDATVGDLIVQHGGMVARYLGDGLLALFGAQQPGETDPENAIRAALEIQSQVTGRKWQVTGHRSQVAGRKLQDPNHEEPATENLQHATRNQQPVTGSLRPEACDLAVRIGIHTGLVVTGEIGSNVHREFTASGDAMNLAARLETAAPPGGILISNDTYRYVRGVFDVTPQPPLIVKGKSQPLQTYLVRLAKPRPFRTVTRGVAGIQTRTVGREQEFEELKAAYLDVFEHRGVVWGQLIGEPGVGKSRVLEDARDWIELRTETVRVLRGRAFVGDTNQPFALVRRMWFDRFQISEDSPLARAEAKWVAGFRELSGIQEEEPAHVLGLLVGLPFKDSPHIGAMRDEPRQLRGRAFVVSRELFRRMREEMPVEMLLEDLQWADASSWEYLREVLLVEPVGRQAARAERHGDAEVIEPGANQQTRRNAEINGMFILGTARPEWVAPEQLTNCVEAPGTASNQDSSVVNRSSSVAPSWCVRYLPIFLPPLTDDATRELALELLQQVEGAPSKLVELIVSRAEGVPYYAEELVNWFIDRGIIDKHQEPWQFVPARFEESPLPATLQHLLLTRLSSLSETERAALQCGAVFGRHFWAGGVEALGVKESGQILAQLAPRGLVHLQPESAFEGESEWSFHHNLMRDVTYESVLKRDRATLHQAAAQWLEEQARKAGRIDEFAGLIGEHMAQAGNLRAAAGWYLQAGEWARTSSALAEASKFFDRALDLFAPDDNESRWRALLGRQAVHDLRGEREAQKRDLGMLRELAESFDDDARRARVYLLQARWSTEMGDYRAAASEAEAAILVARRVGDTALELRALGLQAPAHTRIRDMELARQAAEETLARAEQVTDQAALAFALGRVAIYYLESGDLSRGAQLFVRAVDVSRRTGDREVQASSFGNLGAVYLILGLYKQGRTTLEHALTLHEALGDRRMRAYDLHNLGWAYYRNGDGRTARRLEEQALTEMTAIGDAWGRAGCLHYLGEIVEMAGDQAAASERFQRAHAEYIQVGDRAAANEVLTGVARCTLMQGKPDQAREAACAVWEYIQANGTAGMDSPLRVYQTLADIFDVLNMTAVSYAAIQAGYRELMEQANRISNPEWRQAFLENIPENRAIVELRERMGEA